MPPDYKKLAPAMQAFLDRMRAEGKMSEEDIKELTGIFNDAIATGINATLQTLGEILR